MVRMDEDLSRAVHVKDTAKELIGLRTGVHYKALSADATTAHGTSPALVIHDETADDVFSDLSCTTRSRRAWVRTRIRSALSSARKLRPMPTCLAR